MTAGQLVALAHASAAFGSAALELTDHAGLQIPDVNDAEAMAAALAESGLLPSSSCTVVASPLSGRAGGIVDVRAWVSELDAAIQTEPLLAQLPERFLFSVDDGREDVSGLGADVGVHVVGDHAALVLAGRDTGVRLTAHEVVDTMISAAVRFAEVRGKALRVRELADPSGLWPGVELGDGFRRITRSPVGWLEQDDGRVALGAAVPMGVLPARVAEYLAAIEAPLVVTPWRSILVCDLDEVVADTALRVLAPLGLVFDENSPWAAVGDDPVDEDF